MGYAAKFGSLRVVAAFCLLSAVVIYPRLRIFRASLRFFRSLSTFRLICAHIHNTRNVVVPKRNIHSSPKKRWKSFQISSPKWLTFIIHSMKLFATIDKTHVLLAQQITLNTSCANFLSPVPTITKLIECISFFVLFSFNDKMNTNNNNNKTSNREHHDLSAPIVKA